VKIAVNLIVEMTPEDVEGYAREYGLDPKDKQAIREDVRRYIYGSAADNFAGAEYFKVTLKAAK
jgi:hypothetical protein